MRALKEAGSVPRNTFVQVIIQMTEKGKIEYLHLLNSSGSIEFDLAVLETLKSIKRFITEKEVGIRDRYGSIRITLDYAENDYEIMPFQ